MRERHLPLTSWTGLLLLLAFGRSAPQAAAAAASSAPQPAATTATSTTTQASKVIQAVPDSTTLTSKGTSGGCDNYRHGYIGLTMCVNFYDDTTADGTAVVQVIGSMTNEGQVNLCNLTLSIDTLNLAKTKTPSWLPHYPPSQFFAAGTYFPFSAIIPVTQATTYSYPNVDVSRGFYACDKNLKPLREDQIVPPPGLDPIPAEDGQGQGQGSTGSTKGKINWDGLVRSAGTKSSCLSPCLAGIKGQKDDCKSIAHILSSGCTSTCPAAVPDYALKACQQASCTAAQCRGGGMSSGARPRLGPAPAFSSLLLAAVYGAYLAIQVLYPPLPPR